MGNKLFDYVIGNPPYQGENENNGRKPPVYNSFMDAVDEISDVVELITPARFLFNAGQTPKAWNEKKLNDPNFKVLAFEPDGSKVFQNTDIKGGVAITIRNIHMNYGAIDTFTAYNELNTVIRKIKNNFKNIVWLSSVISSRGNYRTTEAFFNDYPDAISRLGKGTGNMIASNFFEKLPDVNEAALQDKANSFAFLARVNNQRTICYINKKYVKGNDFIKYYNVACPKSNGSGKYGEVLASTEVLKPNEGATDTFISIGKFLTLEEAQNFQKYFSSKFFRALLGAKKVTQDNPKAVWSLIPLQDFTPSSDIDWSKSIHDIDLQLYHKYGLDENEIDFIETHVKEME